MMGKIGIITWYRNGNYGGTLQAFAIHKILQRYGISAEFINYEKGSVLIRQIRNIAFHIKYFHSALSRDAIYKFVKENLYETPMLKSLNTICDYCNEYDAFICGSDQIWSSTSGVDPIYFLQFADKEKRIAYAPSIGVAEIFGKWEKQFVKYVREIPFLSIREKQGAEYIKQIAGIEAQVVLDPTLLLSREEWKCIASDSLNRKKKIKYKNYILCYFLGADERYQDYVERLKLRTGLEVYYISSKRKEYGKKQIVCDPLEFVGLVDGAAYMLTDSFHGTIFSINLGTKVASFERFAEGDANNQNSRIYSILDLLHYGNVLTKVSDSENKLINEIQETEENIVLLEKWRNDSKEYLKKSLESTLGYGLVEN